MLKLERYEGNPILKGIPGEPFHSKYIYNAGATIHDGKVKLVYRAEGDYPRPDVESKWPLTMLGLAESEDGFNFTTHKEPFMKPVGPEEKRGIEDPRISKIDDVYHILFVQVGADDSGKQEESLALATTTDFKTVERKWRVMPDVDQRTSGLLPAKVKGKYVLIHRVSPNMNIAYSEDLKTWHDSKVLMEPRPDVAWESHKIGIGAQPIWTEKGWLLFTHARDRDGAYHLSIAWLDLDDPSKVISRPDYPILEAEAEYERVGLTKNVVYTCGAVEWQGRFLVYYGGADTVLAVASAPADEVMATL